MENLKVRVNSREEQEVARDLLESVGYPKDFICTENEYPRFVIIQDGKSTGAGLLYDGGEEEITLPQLRDIVVLKRDDVKDATHEHKYDGDRYLNINEKWYWHDGNKWVLGGGAILGLLKPIEKGMKQEEPKTGIEATLAQRQSTYGSFEDVSFVTENIVSILKKCNYDNMPHTHRMSMYMIASKMARLVCGDHNHLDSWHDIGGYSKLIEDLIMENKNG